MRHLMFGQVHDVAQGHSVAWGEISLECDSEKTSNCQKTQGIPSWRRAPPISRVPHVSTSPTSHARGNHGWSALVWLFSKGSRQQWCGASITNCQFGCFGFCATWSTTCDGFRDATTTVPMDRATSQFRGVRGLRNWRRVGSANSFCLVTQSYSTLSLLKRCCCQWWCSC